MPKPRKSSKKSTSSKKKSTKSRTPSAVPSITNSNSSVSIRKAENGYIVNVDKSGPNSYISKSYIAPTKKKAKDIASKAL